jgi:hypothetical protein
MPDLDDATLRRVHANVLRFVAKRLPPGIDAQDVVADVLLSFASFRGETSPDVVPQLSRVSCSGS